MEWLSAISNLWRKGSFLLWTLAIAAIAALTVMGVFVFFWPSASTDLRALMPRTSLIAVVLVVLALAKTVQERSIKTLAFVPNERQSFWHLAPQKDGRQLTQVALSGTATNVAKGPIYLADIRLTSPRFMRTNSRHIFTQAQDSNMFSSDHDIPPGGRAEFSAGFFVDQYFSETAKRKTIVVKISDQFGNWHTVRFPDTRRT